MSGLRISGTAAVGPVVLDVDLAVASGETLAVLGPNGAGKTTLLRMLAGLQGLDGGAVHLDRRPLDVPAERTWVPPEQRSVGMVFQDRLLFAHLDVADNVAFGLRATGVPRADARQQALEWLDRLGVASLATARPGELSGGEAQRVALGRALAPSPSVLLLDEPLAALDADVRSDVRHLLGEHLRAHPGPAVLVTHDPLDAAVLADRVVVLEAGRVTAAGSLAELVARPPTAWAAELAGTNVLTASADRDGLRLAAGGRLVAAEAPTAVSVLVAIRPASVTLHRSRPESSARNVWPAVVAGLEGYGERVRVRLDGDVPLVAEITAASVAALDLAPGRDVWASVKATDVVAYPA